MAPPFVPQSVSHSFPHPAMQIVEASEKFVDARVIGPYGCDDDELVLQHHYLVSPIIASTVSAIVVNAMITYRCNHYCTS